MITALQQRAAGTLVAPENMINDLAGSSINAYTTVVGDYFWAMFFTLIAAGVFIKTDRPGSAFAIMVVSWLFCASVLTAPVMYIYGILGALGLTIAIFRMYRGQIA